MCIRDSIEQLLAAGAQVRTTDPEAIEEAKLMLSSADGYDRITFVDSYHAAAEGADAVVLITEWSEFRNPDYNALKTKMKQNILFDGRNVLVPEVVQDAGFEYHGIGRLPPA